MVNCLKKACSFKAVAILAAAMLVALGNGLTNVNESLLGDRAQSAHPIAIGHYYRGIETGG